MKRVVCAGSKRIEYELIRQARKDILIKALPEGVTRVYAPGYSHLREVDNVVRTRIDEILRMHDAVDRVWTESKSRNAMKDGRMIWFEGKQYALKIGRGQTDVRFGEDDVFVWVADPQNEESVRSALRSFMSARALARIRERLAFYGPRIGGTYGRVTIREQKTRWGSCSSKHNLNFNWKLIMAPPPALDYVVIHELCHLHEFNHSERFWKLVAAQMPEYESWKKWLKKHSAELVL